MSVHEHYQELGALAAIGQVTAEEQADLDTHLIECETCREAYLDYSRVLRQQLPLAQPSKVRLPSLTEGDQLRERFFARARAEGVRLSSPPARRSNRWTLAFSLASACTVLAVAAWIGLRPPIQPATPATPAPPVMKADPHAAEERAELTALTLSLQSKSAEIDRLKQASLLSAESAHAVESDLAAARDQVAHLTEALQQAQRENADLFSTGQQSQKLLADLHAQVEKMRLAERDNGLTVMSLQARIRTLTDNLQAESVKLERERQITGIGDDVRKLMGARNLHIIDVHDVDGVGKSAKSFGRVFYSEGESLVFYAFDLPNGKLTPAKYSFQAWGQREAKAGAPRDLGTFRVDDQEQRRWVLKVSDPAVLRDLDAVFVTAEVMGDFREPRGKRVLYAYLGGQPNHP